MDGIINSREMPLDMKVDFLIDHQFETLDNQMVTITAQMSQLKSDAMFNQAEIIGFSNHHMLAIFLGYLQETRVYQVRENKPMKLFGTFRKKYSKFICLRDVMVLDNDVFKINFSQYKLTQLHTIPLLTGQILLGFYFSRDSNTFLAVHQSRSPVHNTPGHINFDLL